MERKHTSRSKKHRVPNKINPKRTTQRHIVIKMTKIKVGVLNQQEKSNYLLYKTLNRLFSTKTADQKEVALYIQSDERGKKSCD